MSRIGNRPIEVPSGVDITIAGGEMQVKGPKGNLSCGLPEGISAELEGEWLTIKRPNDEKETRAMHGLARALVNNMVVGCSTGFRRNLEILGVGYRAEVKGDVLNLLLGFSHPVEMPIPKGLSVAVEANTKVSIEGVDKGTVGQFAADIRSLRPPEPYKGKGVRYDDEHIRRKVGKAGS